MDENQIIKTRRRAVAAFGFAHRQDNALFFNQGIAHAPLADEFGSSPLKKVKIFGIVHYAHTIGFAIGNAMGKPYIGSWKRMHCQRFPGLKIFVLLVGLLCVACSTRQPAPPEAPKRPEVTLGESVEFFTANLDAGNQDLRVYSEMAPSVAKSIRYVATKPQAALAIDKPHLKATWGDLSKTLQRLNKLLPYLDSQPELLAENFVWTPVEGGIDYSGYYEPRVRASRTRKPGYEQPIYALPPDIDTVKAKKGRYHDRRTIEEKGVLEGRGLELAWAADPVDVFFLEIQGSGKLVFDDGTEAYVNYAGQNGHKYKSSGRIMREKGLLKRGDIFEQREWLAANPERVREILNENPSYVFFKYGSRGPTGAIGQTVDDWVSLAVDRNNIPLGAVVAYGVNLPDQKTGVLPARGIGLAQDVGGAIKRNRIDIFCGGDDRANYVASHLDAKGPAWVLLAR